METLSGGEQEVSDGQGRAPDGRRRGAPQAPGLLLALIAVVVGAACCRSVIGIAARTAASSVRAHRDEDTSFANSGLPGYGIVYVSRFRGRTAEVSGDTWDVVWLPGPGDGGEKVVYHARPGLDREIPADLGFLPSPDGRWVCVWETLYSQQGTPTTTVWMAVQLASGRKLPIASQPGAVGYLPFWTDEHTLLLEKGAVRAAFDVRTGRLTPQLPAHRQSSRPYSGAGRDVDSEEGLAPEWRREYVLRHFSNEQQTLVQARQSFPGELAITDYMWPRGSGIPDSNADILLRPMGIVELSGLMHIKAVWPSVAVSPGGDFLARAVVARTGEVVAPVSDRRMRALATFEARLDVYTASGRHLWGLAAPWAAAVAGEVALTGPGMPQEAWFGDLHWSRDGRYLSFTWHQGEWGTVSVVDTSRWAEVVRLPGSGSDAFVVPCPLGPK